MPKSSRIRAQFILKLMMFFAIGFAAAPVHAEDANTTEIVHSKMFGPFISEGRADEKSENGKQENSQEYSVDINKKKIDNYKKTLLEMEVFYQILNIGDAVTTIDLTHRPGARELNPIYGKHPSAFTVVGLKTLVGAAHFMVYRHFRSHDARGGLRFEALSIALQGAVTGANLRFYF